MVRRAKDTRFLVETAVVATEMSSTLLTLLAAQKDSGFRSSSTPGAGGVRSL